MLLLVVAEPPAEADTLARVYASLTAGGAARTRGTFLDNSRSTSDVIGRTSLGLNLVNRRERSYHQLDYVAGLTLHPNNSAANSLAQELALQSEITMTERSAFTLFLNGSHGLVNEVVPVASPELEREDAGPRDAGLLAYAGATLAQAMSYELTPRLSLSQGTDAELFSLAVGTHLDPPIFLVTESLSLGRAWARDSGRVEIAAGYEYAPERIEDDLLLPRQEGSHGRLALGWSHALSPTWSFDASGGAFAARPTKDDYYVFGPFARLTTRWRGEQFRVVATADHGAHPSAALGGIYLSDRLTMRTVGRFGSDERYRLVALFRVQRLKMLVAPEPALSDDSVSRWQAQGALVIRLLQRRHLHLAISLRFTHQNDGQLGPRHLRPLERQAFVVTLTGGWPFTGE